MSQPLDYATPSALKPRKVRPWLLGWLLFLVVALLIFASLHQAPLSHGAIPLSFVYAQIKAGNVANISIDGDTLEGQLRTPALIGSGSVTHFRVELPAGTSANWTFTQWLLEHSPNATVNVETSNNFVSNILMPIIPWALILTFVWLFVVRPLRRKNAHPARPMPVVIVKQEGGVKHFTRMFAALVAMYCAAGCGYTWSNDGGNFSADSAADSTGLYRHDVKTVAVPIFANRTYYRNVEFSLTKSIVNQLESRTPYKVAPKEEADTILEGEITDVGVHLQNRSAFNGLPQEQLFFITVNFTWKDLRTGKILTDRRQFNQSSTYYPTLGEDQFAGSQENVERLGLAIVEELQRDWADVKTPATKP